jgi:hypothetical protein
MFDIAAHAHPDFPVDPEAGFFVCRLPEDEGFLGRSGTPRERPDSNCLFTYAEMQRIATPDMPGTWMQIHEDRRLNGARHAVQLRDSYVTADLKTVPISTPIPEKAILSTAQARRAMKHFSDKLGEITEADLERGAVLSQLVYSEQRLNFAPHISTNEGRRQASGPHELKDATDWDVTVVMSYPLEPERQPDILWSATNVSHDEAEYLAAELIRIYGLTDHRIAVPRPSHEIHEEMSPDLSM